MNRQNLSDAALVVLGHGTTQNENSATPVYQHAAELRRRGIFAEVREAFWKQEPQIKLVLTTISTPRMFIVPLFMSEGYFSGDIIPRELGFPPGQSTIHHPPSTLHYCRPIGTHPGMTNVLLARASEVVEQFPFPRAPRSKDTTLFVAGHGTERSANSRKAIQRQAELIRALDLYASVHAIYLEEEPRIASCYTLALTRNIVLVPFFVSDGLHTQEDIPVQLGEPERVVKQRLAAGQPTWRNPTERNGKLVWYAPAVGTAAGIADVIIDLVQEMGR